LDLKLRRGTGEVGIPAMGVPRPGGVKEVAAGVLGSLSPGVVVVVVAGVLPVGVASCLPGVTSVPSSDVSSDDMEPFRSEPGEGPAARAGNKKLRWTADGRARYAVWTKSRYGCT
jgi:hypothetical protein